MYTPWGKVLCLDSAIPNGYDLVLMSSLPDEDQSKAETGKIYLSLDGTYVVRDLKGTSQKGSLTGSDIDLNNLHNRLNDVSLKNAILLVTSKAGHTLPNQAISNPAISNQEDLYANIASILCALQSIPAQLIYDILNAIFYTIIAIPSFVIGAWYFFYSTCIETDNKEQQAQKQIAQEIFLSNVLLSPYFAIAIIVDFLREFSALFTRTYATVMQKAEERNKRNSPMG